MSAINYKVQNFVNAWLTKDSEDHDCQKFWIDLFLNVLQCSDINKYLEFEKKVEGGKLMFMSILPPGNQLPTAMKLPDKC